MSCKNLSTWQTTRLVPPAMAAVVTWPIVSLFFCINFCADDHTACGEFIKIISHHFVKWIDPKLHNTVHPKNWCEFWHFVVFYCGQSNISPISFKITSTISPMSFKITSTISSISFKITSLTLGQWYDCSNASEVILKDMCKIDL